jgi:spoIIIJ-associated protein
MTEWVEVEGRTVKDAVAAGLAELGLDSPEAAEIEVLRERQGGFLGMGGRSALVRVKAKPKRRRRRRRGRGKGDDDRSDKGESPRGGKGGERRSGKGRGTDQRGRGKTRRDTGGGTRSAGPPQSQPRPKRTSQGAGVRQKKETAVTVEIEEQAQVVREFLEGLLDAFGLEGGVETRVDEDVIYVELTGDQCEALIGPKGSVMQALLELTRTVVHRKTQAGARLRLDIGGYAERRREALRIYVARLAEQVLADGGEVMLEPMNPADRKVVHDAVAEIDGVRSYSEGEEPERSVVVSAEA